ncbi:MAG: amino acid permease [Coxiella sp. RIFCSPHIGHO2_12_FULL_44_14]|nr:MAG: amino acid permease [Coxiella sp. RIFCSPHIGHO2_12_FULL_44_14]
MKRSLPSLTLLFVSVSGILGSGWLFTAYFSARFAGPAALLSWLIGGVIVLLIAFVFAELSAMIPVTGSSTRIPQYTHGTLVNFLFSWIIWLSYAALVPTETQAVLQYLGFFFSGIMHHNGALTDMGYVIAAILMLGMSIINIYSLRWLLRCNTGLTLLKILIPLVLTLIILGSLIVHHTPTTFMNQGFLPFGLHGLLTAILLGGILFSFNGFKQACELAGAAKNPARAMPFAIIGSVIICLIIYLLLQITLLYSLNTHNLDAGWQFLHLRYGDRSPLAAIVQQDHLTALVPILYVGAIIAPLAAALIYVNGSGLSLYSMSLNKQMPSLFQKLTVQGNPIFATLLNFVLGMLLFAPLPGWDKMVTYLSSLIAVTYAVAPICLLALRQQVPHYQRPFKLPWGTAWGVLTFYICTLLIYWSGWDVVSKLGIALTLGLVVFLTHYYSLNREERPPLNGLPSLWVWLYFPGVLLISYLGNFGGGKNWIPFGWDFAVIGLFCSFILAVALRYKLPAADTENYIRTQLEYAEGTTEKKPTMAVNKEIA